jgi:exopolyphosphatase/guanosine-5'-triphosphate,3'-diphosphate pyrophosphatase
MKVAIVDVGTNSTRLLVAEVAGGEVHELTRRTTVTRLGEGVDAMGRLNDDAMGRVLATCAEYRAEVDGAGVERAVAVMTSAVRDARNGADFQRRLEQQLGFEARTISGEQEAQLTFAGATAGRRDGVPTMVLDIGGGSTEVVVGHEGRMDFFVSTQLGSVRHTERHLHDDPPTTDQVAACREAARMELERAVPPDVREPVRQGIAVAGTPTSFAAIDLRLDPYDPERVEGHRLTVAAGERILAELAAVTLDRRRRVTGLHPDRAPTIVAGGAILLEAMALFGLPEIEVSERDILHGTALEAAKSLE